MNLELIRYHSGRFSKDGVLKIAGQKICDTAENPNTALAPGTYPVRIHTCKQYRRKMPCIIIGELKCANCPKLDCVTNNSTLPVYCPMLKIGNGVLNRPDGSIIIGERITWGAIMHSAEHFNRLIDRLDKAANRKEPITLTIQ